jgi:hypothetical protein
VAAERLSLLINEGPTVIAKFLAHLGVPTSHLLYAISAQLAIHPALVPMGILCSQPIYALYGI